MTGRFEELSGTILDKDTGLGWQKEITVDRMSLNKAKEYARGLRTDGYTWRLPTLEELLTLIDSSKKAPASSFPGMTSDCFWSLARVGHAPGALLVYFKSGDVYYLTENDKGRVLCVHEEKGETVEEVRS